MVRGAAMSRPRVGARDCTRSESHTLARHVNVCAGSQEGQNPAKKSLQPVGHGNGRPDPCAWDFCPLRHAVVCEAMHPCFSARSDPRALFSQETKHVTVARA